MIRRVAFKKAIFAGVSGALAWEAVLRVLILAGFPLFDLVYVLGTMISGGDASVWQWWLVGVLMHAMVGAIWAIFYAYFFWSLFDYSTALQGVIFSFLPMILAGFIMIPQMDFMHAPVLERKIQPNGFFAFGVGWLGPVSVVLGHLIYGAVMGWLYTNPVGYAVGQKAVRYG